MTPTHEARLLFRPVDPSWGYLPEGPYALGPHRCSWITIQTAPDARTGVLHRLDLESVSDEAYPLPGRPGFAFPTNRDGVFLIGLERRVVLWDLADQSLTPLTDEIDSHTTGTIINDAVLFEDGLVFGAKDLTFSEQKAGLYFLRHRDLQLFPLRRDQICSNGKIAKRLAPGKWELLDIDTPTRQVVRYELDSETGTLSEPTVALDLQHVLGFPDGMIQVPGREEVIIAMFNPEPAEAGHAIRFSLTSGEALEQWRCAASPQVTCPQLVQVGEQVQLVLTTAAENLSAERLAQHRNAGCLFVADVDFGSIGDQPIWRITSSI